MTLTLWSRTSIFRGRNFVFSLKKVFCFFFYMQKSYCLCDLFQNNSLHKGLWFTIKGKLSNSYFWGRGEILELEDVKNSRADLARSPQRCGPGLSGYLPPNPMASQLRLNPHAWLLRHFEKQSDYKSINS